MRERFPGDRCLEKPAQRFPALFDIKLQQPFFGNPIPDYPVVALIGFDAIFFFKAAPESILYDDSVGKLDHPPQFRTKELKPACFVYNV